MNNPIVRAAIIEDEIPAARLLNRMLAELGARVKTCVFVCYFLL